MKISQKEIWIVQDYVEILKYQFDLISHQFTKFCQNPIRQFQEYIVDRKECLKWKLTSIFTLDLFLVLK